MCVCVFCLLKNIKKMGCFARGGWDFLGLKMGVSLNKMMLNDELILGIFGVFLYALSRFEGFWLIRFY